MELKIGYYVSHIKSSVRVSPDISDTIGRCSNPLFEGAHPDAFEVCNSRWSCFLWPSENKEKRKKEEQRRDEKQKGKQQRVVGHLCGKNWLNCDRKAAETAASSSDYNIADYSKIRKFGRTMLILTF
jgi:hypothetical protein